MRLQLQLTPQKRARLIKDLRALINLNIGGGDGDNVLALFLKEIRFKNNFEIADDVIQFVYLCLDLHSLSMPGTIEPDEGLDHELLKEISICIGEQLSA